MNDDSIRGFMRWVRYPHWEVKDDGEAWTVRFRDLRYQAPYGEPVAGIGVAVVTLPKPEN